MSVQLTQVRAAMSAYSTSFEPARLSCADAASVVREATAIEHMAATVKSLAAARAAEARSWRTDGFRSAEEELAHRTGSSVAKAKEALELGRRLADLPEVAQAARQGALSPTQASAISDAAAADPSAAGRLVDAATAGGSLAELKNQCADVKAKAVDLEARRQAIHSRRYLREWTTPDGEWRVAAYGNPEDGAQIMAALGPLAQEIFQAARRQGRHEHPEGYRFDALLQLALNATSSTNSTMPSATEASSTEASSTADSGPTYARPPGPATTGSGPPANTDDLLATDDADPDRDAAPAGAGIRPRGPAPGPAGAAVVAGSRRRRGAPARSPTQTSRPRRGAPVKLLLRVDLAAFLRGFPTDGETCELVGHGPISMSAVHDVIDHGDVFVAAILTKARQVVGVAHLGRKPTAYQKSAVEWLYPSCAVEGCPNRAHLQIDHRHDWAHTHLTLMEWLDALCHHHHQLKTLNHWALVEGKGKRPFVPPNDPRHPTHRSPTGDRAP